MLASGEFWAAIIGAIVGSIGSGVISWMLQAANNRAAKRERAEARKEREGALAYQLFFTLQQAQSDLRKVRDMAFAAAAEAKRMHSDGAVWRALEPIPNPPKAIHVGPAELAMLVKFGGVGVLNDVRDVDTLHNSSLQAWRVYSERRLALLPLLPGTTDGTVVTSAVTGSEPNLAPRIAEVASLARSIHHFADRDARIADKAMQGFLPIFTAATGHTITLTFGDPPETDSAPAG